MLVLEPGPHLLPDELGDLVADVRREEHLAEAREPQLQRAVLVDLLQHLAALLGRAVGPGVHEVVLEPGERVRDRRLQLVEPGLVRRLLLRAVVRALHRQHVLRGAGEHGEVARPRRRSSGSPGCRWRRCRSTPDPLAGEVDAACGPREVCRIGPRKLSWPSKRFSIGADSMPAQLTKNWASMTSPRSVRDRPAAAVLVEVGAGDGGGELDVLAQVEPVGDVVQPLLDLGLAGELLAPAPVLVELLVEVGTGRCGCHSLRSGPGPSPARPGSRRGRSGGGQGGLRCCWSVRVIPATTVTSESDDSLWPRHPHQGHRPPERSIRK